MPKQSYNYNNSANSYTSLYEQYYFKNTPRKVKPIKRTKKKKNVSKIKSLFYTLCFILLLFYILPFSFKNFVVSTVKISAKTVLQVDYYSLLYPTQSYLNKDLFLGRYMVNEAEYTNPLMIDVPESRERNGLKNKLLELMNDYSRIEPSVYVWEYDGKSYVDINANTVYPAASIIKLPVLIEMFREIEAGKFNLDDKMTLEDFYRASGSGKLQYSQGGREHTLDYLARIMIENSDNSSTNMIISKIGGMHEVNKSMKRWGLKTTHINTWLPDLDGTNVTTARELGKMLYNIDTTDIVSNESKKHMADYLGHVKNNRLLQAGLPSDAVLLHKTGDIGTMLGDAGIVKTANGKKYIVAILVKRPYNHHQGKDFIVKASEIIYKNIAM